MKRAAFLLRMLVLVGATLLLSIPRQGQGQSGGPGGGPGQCINPVVFTSICPSGCVGGPGETNFSAQPAAEGVFYLTFANVQNCGGAQPDQSCNPPDIYDSNYDFQDCCANLGEECTGTGTSWMNCCNQSAECQGTCCLPNGQTCSGDSDCCSGYCNGTTCQTYDGGGGGGGGCNTDGDCPGDKCCDEDTGQCGPCSDVTRSSERAIGKTSAIPPQVAPMAPKGPAQLRSSSPVPPK